MADTIKLKKGPKANRPTLQVSELTCDNDAGHERLIYGGLNGNVEMPNKNDISGASMFPWNVPILFDGITINNIILTLNPVILGTITLG